MRHPDATTNPGGSITGAQLKKDAAGSISFMNVPVQQARDPIGIDFRGTLVSGSIRVQLTDSADHVVWQTPVSKPGAFDVNTVVSPVSAGTYRLTLAWDGPVEAVYSIYWQPGPVDVPAVTPQAFIAGAGMILVALGFIGYAGWRRLGWRYLGLGALAWMGTVALKFAWAVPVNPIVYQGLNDGLPEVIAGPVMWIYVGLLTGVFEVALIWLVVRRTRLGQATWGQALAFGIGFGAVEALLLGVSSLASAAIALVDPRLFPVASLAQLSNPVFNLGPISERLFTVFIHIAANVLIFYAVAQRQTRWFWLAFAYKTAIDAVGAFGQLHGLNTNADVLALEAVVAIWGIGGWLAVRGVQQHYPGAAAVPRPPQPRLVEHLPGQHA